MIMAEKEMPLIGIFIDDVQQEFVPRPGGGRGWNDYYWDDQWTSDWRHDGTAPWRKQWNSDHGTNAKSPVRNITSISSLVLREEPFGGLAYDPVLRTVFCVNETGYGLLKFIRAASEERLPGDSNTDREVLRASAFRIVAFLSSYGVAPTEAEFNQLSKI
jgi:hypothetical protein